MALSSHTPRFWKQLVQTLFCVQCDSYTNPRQYLHQPLLFSQRPAC